MSNINKYKFCKRNYLCLLAIVLSIRCAPSRKGKFKERHHLVVTPQAGCQSPNDLTSS